MISHNDNPLFFFMCLLTVLRLENNQLCKNTVCKAQLSYFLNNKSKKKSTVLQMPPTLTQPPKKSTFYCAFRQVYSCTNSTAKKEFI